MSNKERILIPRGAEVGICNQRIVCAKWVTRTGEIKVFPMIGGIDRKPSTKKHDRRMRRTQLLSRRAKLESMGRSLNLADARELRYLMERY